MEAKSHTMNSLTRIPTLDQLVHDPAQIAGLPADAVQSLWLEASQLERQLFLRLLAVSASNHTAEEDRLLDVEEAAAILSKTVDWLYRHARTLPFVVREGRLVRFSNAGIQKYIRMRSRAG
jgi:predicted DNA-binding transcriptional regulator AlpA